MKQQNVFFETADVSNADCPNCGQAGLKQFYRVPAIPVHSCLLVDTQAEALAAIFAQVPGIKIVFPKRPEVLQDADLPALILFPGIVLWLPNLVYG